MPIEPPFGYITPAVIGTTVAAPVAPASTSAFAMQGLAAIIAPATPSGNVLALFSGTLIDSATTVAEGIVLQMYYGPVISGTAPPANAGAIPASAVAIGPTQEAEDVFFHITEVEDRYLLNENDIRSGMRLAFEAVPGRGGRPAARQVRPVT